ncbi:MAG: serine/threonine-protein kinase [Polyangiales bacterium]
MTLVGDRYEILRPLSEGGMGAVHEALDRVVGRRVALKTLHPHLAGEVSLCERFRREAFAAASLAHPHIAQATDYGIDAKLGPFLVLELVVGESLASRLRRDGAMPVERAAFVAHQMLDALGAAHAVGIVHRDIKPGNLFLTQLSGVSDVVKVLDFGIAKLYESETWQRLTRTGQVIGTPTFMAPEQAHGAEVDARADLYAVGLVLYALHSGQPAYRGGPETIVAILAGDHPRLDVVAPHVPPELVAVVERAISVSRDDRFPDAASMSRALAPWLPSTVAALHQARAPERPRSEPPVVAPPPPTLAVSPGRNKARTLFVVGAVVGLLSTVAVVVGSRTRTTAPTSPTLAAVVPVASPPSPEVGATAVPEATGRKPEPPSVATVTASAREPAVATPAPAPRERPRDTRDAPAGAPSDDPIARTALDFRAQVEAYEAALPVVLRVRAALPALAEGRRPDFCASPFSLPPATNHSATAFLRATLRTVVNDACNMPPHEGLRRQLDARAEGLERNARDIPARLRETVRELEGR